MGTPARIQRLIGSRELEEIVPSPEKIVILWGKAVASGRDARKGLSADNAITLAYQAATQAASAYLESAGYRTRGGRPGHHYNTFYALAAFQLEGLESVDVESETIRRKRAASFYDRVEATERDVRSVLEWLDRLLPAIRRELVAERPAINDSLSDP